MFLILGTGSESSLPAKLPWSHSVSPSLPLALWRKNLDQRILQLQLMIMTLTMLLLLLLLLLLLVMLMRHLLPLEDCCVATGDSPFGIRDSGQGTNGLPHLPSLVSPVSLLCC
jgi:hypothetical protein